MARLIVVLLVFSPCMVFAGLNLPHIGDLGNIPGIGDLISGIPGLGGGEYEPALTTSISDAVTEVPFLDNYNPNDFHQLIPIPGTTGRYHLIPGRWFFPAESYCLHAGTHGPTQGNGYLYAPIKGPLANVVHEILSDSAGHPEIEQHNIQMLIWGLESRTKISDMDRGCQAAAQALLTPADIRSLNGGALGVIPPEMLNQVFSQVDLPPVLRDVVEAETKIRTLMSSGSSTYNELESLAVLGGAPAEADVRDIPEDRWSYNPDGYFAHYMPGGYPSTDVYLAVPDYYIVAHDQLGRIVSVAGLNGNEVDVAYDDSIPALAQGAVPVGYAFADIGVTLVGASSSTYPNIGWTLTSVPANANLSGSGRYTNAAAYAQWAIDHKSQVMSLCSGIPPSPGIDKLIDETIQLGLLTHGVELALGVDRDVANGAKKRAVEILREAWMRNILNLLKDQPLYPGVLGPGPGEPPPIPPEEPPTPPEPPEPPEPPTPDDQGTDTDVGVDMSGNDNGQAACPANTGSQRLGISNRPRHDQPDVNLPPDTENNEPQNPPDTDFDEGRKQGFEDGWSKGFHDGQSKNDPNNLALPSLTHDQQWNQGYDEGYTSGYDQGYTDGKPFAL